MRTFVGFVVCLTVGLPLRNYAQSPAPAGMTSVLMQRFVEKLPPGTVVKVRLYSGRKFSGTLMGTEGNQVTIKPRTRLPEPAQVIPVDAIDSIELQHGNGLGTGRSVLVGIAAGAGAFFGLLVMAMAAVSD